MRRSLVLLGCLLAVGCRTSDPDIPTHPLPGTAPRIAYGPAPVAPAGAVRQVAHEAPPPPPPSVLGLDELLALARSRHPELAAAVARVGEARGKLIQAGLYPNPTVGYSGNQMNDGPGTAGQQGGLLAQEFVTGGKLRIAQEAARFGVTAADWNAVSKWYDIAARVKAAYYEYVTALAVLRETERMAELFEQALARTEKLADAGRVESYDVTRLRVELTQARNRVGFARQRVAAAHRMLGVAVGADAAPGDVAGRELPDAAPLPGYDEAVQLAEQSSFVLAPAAEVEQARAEVRLAEVKPIPNPNVYTIGAHDYVTRAPMATVEVAFPLPLWDRNQGNVLAAKHRLHVATAGVGQARLRTVERLTAAYQKYENARRQLELYRTKVLPDAAAALEQIDKVYAARGERFFDTLDARRVLAQARIDYAQTLGDLWAAVAEIEAVIQAGR